LAAGNGKPVEMRFDSVDESNAECRAGIDYDYDYEHRFAEHEHEIPGQPVVMKALESLGRVQSVVLDSITITSTASLSTSTRPKKRQIHGMQRSGSGEICG
jgi:hypothetical protein